MQASALKLSRSEWKQVANLASRLDWSRHGAGQDLALDEAGLTDRTAEALRQLLLVV